MHNVETMAYAGQVPWHGLGTRVADDLSVPDMLYQAGIDWTVRKQPLFYEVPEWDGRLINKRYPANKDALVRESDNSLLSVVGPRWNPCQNDEAFQIFEDAGLQIHTAGSLRDGQIVWGLAKMKEQFVLFNEDVTEQYLLLVNPHQYGKTIHVRNTPVRVVCNNTLSLSLSQNAEVTANQHHGAPFDVEKMRQAIGISTLQLERYAEMARFMGSRRYNDQSVQDYFDRVFPNMSAKLGKEHSRNATLAMEVLETQPGARYGEGTWWQAFNTVTYMADHLQGKSQSKRLDSAWFGQNATRKVKALDLAVKYAEAA